MVLSTKILLILSLFLFYIHCELSEEELSVLNDLSNAWEVELYDCSSEGIKCCNGNTTVCEMYVNENNERI